MIEDIFYFGYIVFLVFLVKAILQIVLSVIWPRLGKNGNSAEDEYHRLYEESMEWLRNELKTSK